MRLTRPVTLTSLLVLASVTGCGDPAPMTPADGGTTPPAGDSSVPTPPAVGSGAGFMVRTHGFPFQNYTNEGVTNLTAAEMRRMYGDRVCASGMGDSCALTPQAEQWMTQINQAMSGGHCEGMAVLAQMFHAGRRNPMDFGGPNAAGLMLMGNTALQREVAYWFALQAVEPTSQSRIKATPSRVVEMLRASFAATATQSYTIAFFKPGPKEGHAVTPTGVRDGANGRVDILVYDNNFPNEERAIEVDTRAETWRYQAAANPMEAASLYEGTAMTETLQIVPLGQRLATHVCDFCGNYTAPMTRPAAPDPMMPMPAPMMTQEPPRQVQMSGEGDAQVMTPMGMVGTNNEMPMNTVPGASVTPLTSAQPWLVELEPVYRIPSGLPMNIAVNGDGMGAMSPTDITVTGRGYSLAVRGIELDPGQRDTVTIAPVGAGLRYTTTQSESADVVVGAQFEGADWRFIVRTQGEAGGQSISVSLDPARGVLVFGFDGAMGAMNDYDIEVVRADAQGSSTFRHTGNAGENGDDLVLHYGDWGGDGMPMELGVDDGGDGSEDRMMPLSDM